MLPLFAAGPCKLWMVSGPAGGPEDVLWEARDSQSLWEVLLSVVAIHLLSQLSIVVVVQL